MKRCATTGKTQWSTKKLALGSANTRAKVVGYRIFTYKCPDCKYWHLTSNEPYATKARIVAI